MSAEARENTVWISEWTSVTKLISLLTSFLIHWSEAIRALSNLVDMIYYEDIGVQRYTQENLNKYSAPWRRAGGSTATG